MMRVAFLIAFVVFVPLNRAVVVAEKGQARLPIVVAEDASEDIRLLAKEFAGILQEMTGAQFLVKTGEADGLILGTVDQFPDSGLNDRLKIKGMFDGVEAFAIHPRDGRGYFIGATAKGVSHAVFTFLKRLGCRWFFPAPEWTVIPKHERVIADFTIVDRPAILSRRIGMGFGYFDRREGRVQREYESWKRRNRMAQSFRTYTGHAWQSIVLENTKIFDAHPEYLALVKGKRRGPQLCVSHPKVRELATAWALRRLRIRPELDMVSMETSDGLNHCECDSCRAMGTVSDRAFGLANEVARAVQREFPGKMVGMLAYSDHSVPPSGGLEPNVYVRSTAGYIHGKFTFEELMKLWRAKTDNYGFYEYYSVWQWDRDQLPGGRANDMEYLTRRIRQYRHAGATSILGEASNSWGLHGRGYYLASQMMWNPDSDPHAILNDFYQRAFGPAAKVMQRYYERFDRSNQPLMSTHLLGVGFRDIDEASRLASNDAGIQSRLNHLKQYLHYVRLRWDVDHNREDEDLRKRTTIDALTWCYRTRYSYMNHWAAMWQSWTKKAAAEFDEPEWSAKLRRESYEWADKTPVTNEETERVFQSDLKYFQPQPLLERRFTGVLVHPGFENPDSKRIRTRSMKMRFQRGRKFALASRQGERIGLRVQTGIIKGYRNRPDVKWSIAASSSDEILAEGRLPLDGQEHEIRFTPPQAGVYILDIDDSGAAFGVSAEAGVPISLQLERARPVRHLGQFQEPVFFYVPKGTRQLQFYWKGGKLKPRLFDPDGNQIAEISANGKYVTVDIPEGKDGKPWHFRRFAPKQFWMVNAPNVLAATPSALIVPRDAK